MSIGGLGQVGSMVDGKFTSTYSEEGYYSILRDKDGIIWSGTISNFLTRDDGLKKEKYDVRNSTLSSNYISHIQINSRQVPWIISNSRHIVKSSINKIENGKMEWIDYSSAKLKGYVFNTIKIDHSDHLWIGTDQGGVLKYDGTTFSDYTTQMGTSSISDINEDSAGNIWINSFYLKKFDGQTWVTTNSSGVFNNGTVYRIVVDAEGNIWAPSERGLHLFNNSMWLKYGSEDRDYLGLTLDKIGSDWIISFNRKQKRYFGFFPTPNAKSNIPLPNFVYNYTIIDPTGGLWLACEGGYLANLKNNQWKVYSPQQSGISGNITYIDFDAFGNTFIGTEHGLVLFNETGVSIELPRAPTEQDPLISLDPLELNQNKLRFYPNPTSGVLWVDSKITDFEITDCLGNIVPVFISKEGHRTALDFKTDQKGIFFLRSLSNPKVNCKFILE